jgi:arylsulfatase A-like enzyme
MDNADILPTILGILNIPVANIQFDGKDMSKILEGSSNINEQRYFYSVNRSATKFAISDERYHFIYSTDGSKCNFNSQKEELYNYIDDPDETDNLAEKQTDTKDKMKNLLLKYISENNNFSNALYYLEKDKDSNSEDINRLKSGGY